MLPLGDITIFSEIAALFQRKFTIRSNNRSQHIPLRVGFSIRYCACGLGALYCGHELSFNPLHLYYSGKPDCDSVAWPAAARRAHIIPPPPAKLTALAISSESGSLRSERPRIITRISMFGAFNGQFDYF